VTGKLIELGAHTNMSPNEVLQKVQREGMTEVMVMGYDRDGDLVIRSSKGISRKDALWYSKLLESSALEVNEEED
jgi:hypothetical protein